MLTINAASLVFIYIFVIEYEEIQPLNVISDPITIKHCRQISFFNNEGIDFF